MPKNAFDNSKIFLWLGKTFSISVVLFLLVDATIHELNISVVRDASLLLGFPPTMTYIIGILEFICIVLYLLPRTKILGAILLTGYLGGAVAINLRAGTPLLSNILFPVYVGLFVWGGLFFQDKRVRSIIPFIK